MHDVDKPILVGLLLLVSVLVAILATGIFGVSNTPFQFNTEYTTRIAVGGTPLYVEIADTPIKRTNGLSGREYLKTNNGMLFVFQKSDVYSIWMRSMQFPIDIYWADATGKITDMWVEAQPSSYPNVFTPKHTGTYILEVPALFSQVYNIKIGEYITGIPK